MGLDPAKLSPAFKACMHPIASVARLAVAPCTITHAEKRPKGMNQTERRCFEMLKEMRYRPLPSAKLMPRQGYDTIDPRDNSIVLYPSIRFEAITLHLGYRCKYTPDFLCENGLKPAFYECKGAHVWEDSMIKFKAAAQMFPCFSFYFAQWKNKAWHVTKYS